MAISNYTTSQLGILQAFGLSPTGLLNYQANPLGGFSLGGMSGLFDGLLPETYGGRSISFTAPNWLAQVGPAPNSRVSVFSTEPLCGPFYRRPRPPHPHRRRNRRTLRPACSATKIIRQKNLPSW